MLYRSWIDKIFAWLPVLPLLLLVLATWWLNRQVQPLPENQREQRHDPDYTIERFSAVVLDTQGRPLYNVSAKRLWHHPDDDSTRLEAPRLTHSGSPVMSVSARTGKTSSKAKDIYLYDEVSLLRRSDEEGEQHLTTDYLHIDPEHELADTDRQVVISSAHSTLRATGMKLDNRARTIKLLSRVQAIHVPTPH